MAQGFTLITNLPAWTASLNTCAQRTESRILQAAKKLVFDALSGIIFKNPVKTGRSRAGWFVSVGEGTRTEISPPRQRAYSNAGSVISRGQSKANQAQSGQAIWIYNNVDYIEALEFGRSRQAPQGMVRVTLSQLGGEERFSQAITHIIQQEWEKS